MALIHYNDKLHFLSWLVRQNPAKVLPKVMNYARYLLGSDRPDLRYLPAGIGVAITERCNMDCRDCYWRGSSRRGGGLESKDLAPAEFEKVLKRFGRSAVHCSITGGEPLLHGDVFRFVELSTSQPLYTSLFTNGVLLDRFEDALLKSGLSILNISPHGLEEHPESARDPETIRNDRTLFNISRLVARRSGSRMRIAISVMVTRQTYFYMKDIINAGEVLGVDVVRLMSVLPSGDPPFDALASWDDDELQSYFRDELLPMRPAVDVVMPKFFERGAPKRTCQELFRYLKFSVSGDVYPCCYLPLDREYGNAFSGDFDWNSDALRDARARMLDRNSFKRCCAFCAHVSTRNIQYNRLLRRWTGPIDFVGRRRQ